MRLLEPAEVAVGQANLQYGSGRVRTIRAMMGVMMAVLLAFSSMAAATANDATETRAFVAAVLRVDGQAVQRYGREKAAANALIEHVQAHCPNAVPGQVRTGSVAQQKVWTAFQYASGAELALAEVNVFRRAERGAVKLISHLRWSHAPLNRAVAQYVLASYAVLSLHSPDLCREISAARVSGFSVVPRRMTTFLRGFRPAEARVPSLSALAGRMRPYADPAEKRVIGRVQALGRRWERLNTRLNDGAYIRLQSALFG